MWCFIRIYMVEILPLPVTKLLAAVTVISLFRRNSTATSFCRSLSWLDYLRIVKMIIHWPERITRWLADAAEPTARSCTGFPGVLRSLCGLWGTDHSALIRYTLRRTAKILSLRKHTFVVTAKRRRRYYSATYYVRVVHVGKYLLGLLR